MGKTSFIPGLSQKEKRTKWTLGVGFNNNHWGSDPNDSGDEDSGEYESLVKQFREQLVQDYFYKPHNIFVKNTRARIVDYSDILEDICPNSLDQNILRIIWELFKDLNTYQKNRVNNFRKDDQRLILTKEFLNEVGLEDLLRKKINRLTSELDSFDRNILPDKLRERLRNDVSQFLGDLLVTYKKTCLRDPFRDAFSFSECMMTWVISHFKI